MKQKAKRFWKFAQILAILVVLTSSVTQAQPASIWTTSTSGAWNDSANWNSGIVPNGNAVNITATGASYTVNYALDDGSGTFTNLTLGTGTLGQVADLTVNTTGFNNQGNLTLNGGGQIDVNNGGVYTQTVGSTSIVGSAATGNAILNVNNGGSATMQNIHVGNGSDSNSQINIAAGGTLTETYSTNMNLSSGTITNAGTVNINNPLVMQSGGVITNTGTFALVGVYANLYVASDGNGSATFNMNGGSLTTATASAYQPQGGITIGSAYGSNGITGNFNTTAGSVNNNGSLIIGVVQSNTFNRTATGNFNMSGGTWNNSNSAAGNNVLLGVYDSVAGGTVSGPHITGNATISGTAAFTSAGTVFVGGGGATGNLNIEGGSFTVGPTGSLELSVAGTAYLSGGVTTLGTGNLNLSGGTLTTPSFIANSGSNLTFSGGTMSLGAGGATVATGSAFTVGDGTHVANLNMTSNSATYTFSDGVQVKSNSVITATGALTAGGTGLTVNSGGTFGGNGSVTSTTNTINGNVQVGSGGINTTDVLTMTSSGATTFSGANLTFNLSATTLGQGNELNVGSSSVLFSGAATTLTLNLIGSSIIPAGTDYILIAGTSDSQYSGLTLSGSEITNLNLMLTGLAADGQTNQIYYGDSYLFLNNGNIDIHVVPEAVPEPATWALMLGGLALLIVIQRRRRLILANKLSDL